MLLTTSSKLESFRKTKYLEDDAGDNEGEKDSVELVLCSYLCFKGYNWYLKELAFNFSHL